VEAALIAAKVPAHLAANDCYIADLALLGILQEIRKSYFLIFPSACALLKYLPEHNEARKDKDPKYNCLDR
jgi:hypothetical protein